MVHPAPPRPPPWASRVRALLHPAPQSPPQNLPPPPPTKQQAVWSATSPAWPSPWPSASHTCQPSPSSSSSPPSSASPVVLKGISGKKIVTSCSQGQIKSFSYSFPPLLKMKFVNIMKMGKIFNLILKICSQLCLVAARRFQQFTRGGARLAFLRGGVGWGSLFCKCVQVSMLEHNCICRESAK